ncbi:MAG TPA: hypothetical protein VKC89_02410 [Patescibacteria group bacterium]|nr:hypothetical protein [Patescibacteria group bacterium]
MKTRNINFRETKSERSATNSYKNFGKFFKEKFQKVINNKKYGKS